MPAPKKAETLAREVEAELADTTARIEQERDRREAALLADDTNALDAIELTMSRLSRAAGRQQERLRLLQKQVQAEQDEAVNKRRQALRERWARKAAERHALAVEAEAAAATLLTAFRKIIEISEELRAAWPTHNSHTDSAAGTPEGAALSGAAVKVLLANHLYRISCDPWLGGQPGERRQQSLPGAVCPRLDWAQIPDKIPSFAASIKQANTFGVETMTTTLDPLKALTPGQAVAPVEPDARTDKEQKLATLLAKQAQLANDVTPEGEAAYMANLDAITRLSNDVEQQSGATK